MVTTKILKKIPTNVENSKNNTILLVGFPGSGLIGTFTVSYIIQSLKMNQIAELDHPELMPTLFIENGEIFSPIRFYKKNNIYAVISDVPFSIDVAYDFTSSIKEFTKKNKIDTIIISGGLETIERSPKKSPKTYALVTHKSLERLLYENDLPKFLTGTIIGTDAAVISEFRKSNTPALILYTQCHPDFPDPDAAIFAIKALSKILKIQVDTKALEKKAEYLRIQNRKLMEETLNLLHASTPEKKDSVKTPSIYR